MKRRERPSRRTRTTFRILALREWRRALTKEDCLLLRNLQEIDPARMREVAIGLRQWAYRKKGSASIPPVLFQLVDAGRELRKEAGHRQQKHAEALPEPFVDIQAVCEPIS